MVGVRDGEEMERDLQTSKLYLSLLLSLLAMTMVPGLVPCAVLGFSLGS